MTNTTKKEKVLHGLMESSVPGRKGLTPAQIEARYGVVNVTATINKLRFDGYPIFTNRRTDTKGRTNTFYRMGRAPRSVVAAGYKALALGMFNDE